MDVSTIVRIGLVVLVGISVMIALLSMRGSRTRTTVRQARREYAARRAEATTSSAAHVPRSGYTDGTGGGGGGSDF